MTALLGCYAALAALAAASPPTCPADVPLSCHNETAVENTCCFLPAGQLLQTQFWDTQPATGPSGTYRTGNPSDPESGTRNNNSSDDMLDSWTIHGLWPDNCDGSFPARCDPSRAYRGIEQMLSSGGASASDTLRYMRTFWKDRGGHDEALWRHEWGKHGTCVSSLEPRCYGGGVGGGGYRPGEEAVVDFFETTVGLFRRLPTYRWLADAGIHPSEGRSYGLDRIRGALAGRHGAGVTLGCEGDVLNQVWYHFNVRGSLQAGRFVASQPRGTSGGKCPSRVRYRPKSGGREEPPGR
ncbi:hypothetical protein EsHS_00002721 [Epichloe bromicola]